MSVVSQVVMPIVWLESSLFRYVLQFGLVDNLYFAAVGGNKALGRESGQGADSIACSHV